MSVRRHLLSIRNFGFRTRFALRSRSNKEHGEAVFHLRSLYKSALRERTRQRYGEAVEIVLSSEIELATRVRRYNRFGLVRPGLI